MSLLADKVAAFKRFRSWLMAENAFYGKLLLSSCIGVLSIALLAAIFLYIAIRDYRHDGLRTRTLQILRLANKVDNDLASLETGRRGYLLTGQEYYVEPFERRKQQIKDRLDELQTYFAVDSAQRVRVQEARSLIEQWEQKVAEPQIQERRRLAAADKNGLATAAAVEAQVAKLGKSLVDVARKTLQMLQENEEAALNARTRRLEVSNLSFQVLVFIPKLESVVSEMEKAQCGYLLSGSNTFVDAYKQAAGEFSAYYGHISVLLQGNRPQMDRFAKLKQGVEQWQEKIATPEIEARRAGQNVAPMVIQGRGKQVMEGIHAAIDEFERAELDNYQKIRFKIQTQRVLETAGFSMLCVLSTAFLIASSWFSFLAYQKQLRSIASAEEQTRSIIENTLDAVLTIDDQGLITTANPAAAKMFGFEASDLLGESISKIIPQRLFMHDMASLGRGTMMAMASRQGFYPFPIEISLSDMLVENKRRYVALIRDVTERKRSEDTLKHIGLGVSSTTGKEFVRTLVKQLSKALDTDFSFILETKENKDETCSLVLAEQGQIRIKSDYELLHTACDEVLKKGFKAYSKEVRGAFPNDPTLEELAAESLVAMPLADHKGRNVGVMGVIHRKPMDNIQIAESTLQIFATRAAAEIERKHFEEALAAEKERLAVTLRSIGDGFITTDVSGNILMINNVAERLTGWSQQQVIGKQLVEVFHILNERSRKPCRSAVQRIIETGSAVGMATHSVLVSRDGAECIVEISASPIRDKANRRLGVVVVFRDVTEKLRNEEEHRKAEKLESLGVAAGGIAHDFNNLLTAIIGNLSLSLTKLQATDPMAERLTTAKKAAARAQELAQQLLTFAKGGAPVKKITAMGRLVKDSVSFSLRGSNVRCEFDIPDDTWSAEVDDGQISQVITNVVVNAEQAMPAGGRLFTRCENFMLTTEDPTLTSLRMGRYVHISIKDEGVGIPEEYLKKIFDPYFTTKAKGSGLGLATAYSIIKGHEGQITVESVPGSGTTFHIYIPASEKKAATTAEKEHGQAPKEGKGRILILDDEEAIRLLVYHTLTSLGYEVTEAADSLTAIDLYKKAMQDGKRFDAVISDLTLPGGMGGQEAVKHLIEIDPTVKAIVSSGYANDPVMSRYQEYGFCAMIPKPYEVSELSHVVYDVINSNHEILPAESEPHMYQDFAHVQLN
jgi:PAS domain S-box-containing protein